MLSREDVSGDDSSTRCSDERLGGLEAGVVGAQKSWRHVSTKISCTIYSTTWKTNMDMENHPDERILYSRWCSY